MMKFIKACIEGAFVSAVALTLWVFFGTALGIPIEFYWDFISIAVVVYILISFITKLIKGDD